MATPRAGLALAGLLALPSIAPAGGPVRPPALQYQVSTLPNGLRVILSEDHSTPLVNVQVWYHVGSKNERPGRTGFAHLFEHLMFQGSKNVGPDAHTSQISRVGGQCNAYTTEDVTVFWETVPSQYLPLALWLEADRMATLKIDKETFNHERDVVKEERRMRVENQPYGRLPEIIYDAAFSVHPYRHTTIGMTTDLEAATVEDVREFYRTYYTPGNATLVVVGDFDPAQATALANKYLGRIPASAGPVPRDIPAEPAPSRGKRLTLHERWPLAVVVVAHYVPADGHADSYPLQVASTLLSDGQSSRIHRTLVYEQGLAASAFGLAKIVEDPGLFFAVAIVQPGRLPEEAERALTAELERLKDEPVSERELARVRNQLARDSIIGRESNQQKAAQLAHAAVIHGGDVASTEREFDRLMGITAADVQRAARSYFTPERRVVIAILPEPAAAGGPAR